MKRILFMLILCVWANFPSFAQPHVGTWRITSATYTNARMQSETVDQSQVDELKIITPTHFMWMSQVPDSTNKARKVFGGAGGGHYSLDGIKYIESLEYASWEDYETNKTDFSLRVEGDKMYQMGAISNQTGDKTILQEVWQRENVPANNGKLAGTWHLVSQKITDPKGVLSTTDMTTHKRVKVITPTHWMYIAQSIHDGKKAFTEAAGGTYTLEGNKYTQKHAFDHKMQWESTFRLEGDKLSLNGWSINGAGEKYLFEEVYQREKEMNKKVAQRLK